jgi:hypothetical protein
MKLAFYIAKKGDWLDKLIALATSGPFSHVEIILKDNISFSSSSRDHGTRFKYNINFNSGSWELLDLSKFNLDYNSMFNFCNLQINKPYDYIGTFFGAGLNLDMECKKKWFCSEIIAKILDVGGLKYNSEEYYHLNPNSLYKIIKSKL